MRRAKAYVEALPSLSFRAVQQAREAGQRILEWTSESGIVIGHVEVLSLTNDSIQFRHRFFGTPNVEKSDAVLTIPHVTRRLNPTRNITEFICPKKGCRVDLVYFAHSGWGCRNCHGLVHLVNRLSPHHKSLIQRDALSSQLADVPVTERRTRTYHNAKRKLERLQRETRDDPMLPEQLRFRAVGRWLMPQESFKLAVVHGEQGYGWVPGDHRGLAAFHPERSLTATSIPKPAKLVSLQRFPASPLLEGIRLFKGDLMKLLTERFTENGLAAGMEAVRSGVSDQGELEQTIAAAASISRLELIQRHDEITTSFDDDGRRQVACLLPYTGDVDLWRVKAGPSAVPAKLRAALGEKAVRLAVTVSNTSGDAQAAAVIRYGHRLIQRQLRAQSRVLDRFDANLMANASSMAAQVLKRTELDRW